ncbi:hypothetical protein BJ508DRAFT_417604 [Ascobolus immersus RN42]|uniref:Uncharacterized protein n=1 Tax=Ascobolus immersus RN42 TaxID=1160509 RepID=A0A3N4HRC5_ASCIM|nr:hypothetical protein BJ508DRAFT_417604 [Ascobolus immersus RN42]
MSSYAEVAAHNSEQSPEEAAAPQPPQLETTTGENTSLPDVDSASVNVVPHDYLEQEVKTSTQADRIEIEAEQAKNQAELNIHTAEEKAKEAAKEAKEEAKEEAEKAKAAAEKIEKKAEKKVKEAEEKVKRKVDQGKEAAKKGLKKAEDEWNEEPEVVINTAISSIIAVALGVVGWQRYKVGRLGLREVGIAAAGLAVFGGLDYFFTRQFIVKRKERK